MVTVYTKDYCPYCTAAKNLLKENGVAFEEVEITPENTDVWAAVMKRSGMRTVPQIFHNDKLIGGFDQLNALYKSQGLEHLKS